MTANELPLEIPGLGAIADRYGVAICDVWGVLHNGTTPFTGTIEALRAFRAAHGPVILLTNAPRPATDVKLQFDRIGVPHDCYDVIVTSGEGAREELMKRSPGSRPLPVFILGPERDRAVHAGLNIVPSEAEVAEIVLCTGLFDDETESPENYRALLEIFLSRRLSFLCANPDLVVRRGDKLVYCAGAIARLYEEMCGEVVYFGKPYAPVFELAMARARSLGVTGSPLMIGDGLETDIKGAEAMGWDALFVLGGIHGVEIGTLPPARAEARLKELFAENHASARWRISELRW